ncbi:MAG: hypothetical protein K0S53_1557 [Bacteroidetes bacterium]|jgi:hypothetical protein|nr:hypothetical protein [Bacteroidota bacterium]MDF2453123.1 hypothetical protein [Bacteroidota bacterium]
MSVIQEEKTGVIEMYFDMDAGTIKEDGSGESRDFYHPGAQVEYVIGDAVSYRLISLPNGRTITKDIKSK